MQVHSIKSGFCIGKRLNPNFFETKSKMADANNFAFTASSRPGSRDPGEFCLGSRESQSILARDQGSQAILLRDLGDGKPGI